MNAEAAIAPVFKKLRLDAAFWSFFISSMVQFLVRFNNYFFRERIYFTISVASALLSAGCGLIGTAPQTPAPPLMILSASDAMFASVASYFAATLEYAGPTIFL